MIAVPSVVTPVAYRHGSAALEGALVTSEAISTPAPTVLILHGAEGFSDLLIEMGREHVLPLGYQAFAVDLFGKGVSGTTPEEFDANMGPFLADRAMLADRLATVVSVVAGLPKVDSSRLAAIGFCFGGLCVLDMARAGVPVRGIASVHGVLKPPPGRPVRPIDCAVSVYHGWEDPFAPPEDVVALAAELTEAGADWRIQAFGHAKHAFMAPFANSPERGIQYDARTTGRTWSALEGFLVECLS